MKFKENAPEFGRETIYNSKIVSGDEINRVYEIEDDTDTFVSYLEKENVPYIVSTDDNREEGHSFVDKYGIKNLLNIIPSDGGFGIKTIIVKKPDVFLSVVESFMVDVANRYMYG